MQGNLHKIYKIFKKYCKKIKYVDIKNIFELIFGLIFTGKIIIKGLNSGKQIERLINKVCNEKGIYQISDIKMPLAIPSVDLCNGDVICFTSQKFRNNMSDNTIFTSDIERFVTISDDPFVQVFIIVDNSNFVFPNFNIVSFFLEKYINGIIAPTV